MFLSPNLQVVELLNTAGSSSPDSFFLWGILTADNLFVALLCATFPPVENSLIKPSSVTFRAASALKLSVKNMPMVENQEVTSTSSIELNERKMKQLSCL